MDIIVQGKKRKKVFLIEDDGNIQYAPEFTVEEQQSFSISKLELWKEAEINNNYDSSSIMDSNHAKLSLYQDKSLDVDNNDSTGNTKLTMKKSAIKRAIDSATKAATELSILTQVAALVQSNKILNLQTFNKEPTNTTSLNSNNDEYLSETQSNSQIKPARELPLAQRIYIQVSNMKATKSIVLNGIEKCKKLINRRQNYSNIIRLCSEENSLNICYIDTKINKRIYHRNYDSKKDYIAIDCSIPIIPYEQKTHSKKVINPNYPSNLNKPNQAKKPQYIANDFNTTERMLSMTKLTNYVPIIQNNTTGLVEIRGTGTASGTSPSSNSSSSQDGYTLQLQLQMLSSTTNSTTSASNNSRSTATTTIHTIGTTTLWDLLGYSNSNDNTPHSSSRNTEDNVTQIDAIHTLTQHCKRQKHETLCHNLFDRLRIECIETTTLWNVLQSAAYTKSLTCNTLISSDYENLIRKCLNKIVHEKLSSNIGVVDIRDDKIVLQLSELLLLTISLIPLSKIDNNSSSGSSNTGNTTTINDAVATIATAMEVEVADNSTTSVVNRSRGEGCSIQTRLQYSIEELALHTILSILPTTPSTTTQQVQTSTPRENSYWNTIKQYEILKKQNQKDNSSLIQKFQENLINMIGVQHK